MRGRTARADDARPARRLRQRLARSWAQPPVTGGKKATSQPSRRAASSSLIDLVQRHAHRLAARQRAGMGAAARDQLVAQARPGWRPAVSSAFAAGAQRLAHRGEVAHVDSSCQQLREGNEAHGVAAPMGWPAGLSITPSPQTVEVSTPELWLGTESSPPSALQRARRNSRRRSALGQSKSARIAIGARRHRARALQRQQEGPHQQQEGDEAGHRVAGQADEMCASPMRP